MKRVYCLFAVMVLLLIQSLSATAQSSVFRSFLRGIPFVVHSLNHLNQMYKENVNNRPSTVGSSYSDIRSFNIYTQPIYFGIKSLPQFRMGVSPLSSIEITIPQPKKYSLGAFSADSFDLTFQTTTAPRLTFPSNRQYAPSFSHVYLDRRVSSSDTFRFLDFNPSKFNSTSFDGQFRQSVRDTASFQIKNFSTDLFSGYMDK